MKFNLKYAVEASVFMWSPADRVSSYKEPIKYEEAFNQLKAVKGIEGIELYYPYDFENIKVIKSILDTNGLSVSAVGAGFFAESKWQNGSVTSNDAKIRREAIDIAKKSMDIASELKSGILVFWPGHDGYDYYFQTDYQRKWEYMLDALREIASYNKEISVGIEYKTKEPRTHQFISSAAKASKISKETEMKNVGVVMDIGHSFLCGENPAEEVAYLMKENKLFHLHNNDNYNDWDYDMLPGSVHFWENIEVFYWLNKLGYNGWINFDIFPTRFDATKASSLCIKNTKKIVDFVTGLDEKLIQEYFNGDNVLDMQAYLWDKLFI
jgi:sugar phosphate isomerase/epimerase